MTDNMFDKFVSSKLRDHQSPVPPGLWDKIERNKGKDPKGAFLPRTALWAGLFIIAASIGIGVYVYTGNTDTNNISQVTDNTAAANTGGNSNNATTPTQGNEAPPDNNTRDAITNNNQTPDNLNDAGDNSTNITLDANPVKQAPGNDAAFNDGNATDPGLGNRTNSPGIRNDKGANLIFGKKKNTLTKKSGTMTSVHDAIDTDGAVTFNEAPALASLDRLSFASRATIYNLRSLAKADVNTQYNLSELQIVRIDCPPNGRQRRNDWYLEVYGSPDIVMKTVKAEGNATLVSKKDSTESQQISFSAGLRISKSIGENLLLKTGVQYSQINERFDLRTENERRIITVVTIRTVPGSNGADSTISDTSTVEQIGYRLQRSYNRYRSIDIPLLLSYEFGGENLRFAVNAGAIFNLYSWYSGNTLNDSMMVVSMNSKNSGVYKHNIGVGIYGGFSIMKPVSNRLDIMLEPYFRYNFSNMSRSAGYTQKFQALGINLGLRYKLKGQRSGLK